MIIVQISINHQVIVLRGGTNMSEINKKGETKYQCDTGDIIWHKREDGAVVLAKKLLDTVKDLCR